MRAKVALLLFAFYFTFPRVPLRVVLSAFDGPLYGGKRFIAALLYMFVCSKGKIELTCAHAFSVEVSWTSFLHFLRM